MKTRKSWLILSAMILILFVGIFTFHNREKKSEKISLSPSEKIWLKKQKSEKIPFLLPDNESLYLYKTPKGDTAGVYYDYIQWLEREYGLQFDLIQKGNSYASEKINSGEAVLAYNSNRSYDREKIYSYLDLEAKTSIVLVKRSDRDFSKEKSSIKKLGMVQNTSETNNYFLKYSPYQYNKTILSSYEEGIEKLKNGEIDLLLGKSKDFLYKDVEIDLVERLSDLHYSLAVNRKYPELYSFLEKTLAVFHQNQFKESFIRHKTLYNTQMLKDSPILQEIRKKYSKITVELLEGEDYRPLYYFKDDKFYGYIPTLLDSLSTSIGIPFEIVRSSSPEKKHVRAMDTDRNTPLSIPYYNWDIAVAGKTGTKYVKSYNDLREKRVAYVANKYTEDIPTKEYLNFTPYQNFENALKDLKADEVDYIMGDFILLDSEIENMYLSDEIKILGFLEKSRYSLAFTFDEENRILYTLFLQIFPKDISEYSQLKDLLVSPKLIKINYYHLGSLAAFFLAIIGIILLFLKNNIDHRNKVEKLNRAMISSFEMASSFNDEKTAQHIVRVAKYSELLAKEVGLSSTAVRDIDYYASLHDIGKIGVPSSILKKPGKLTLEEMAEMRKHPNIGYRLVRTAGLGRTAENIVRFHHEKWDGTGYPLGLKGSEIPIEARIVALADIYDTLRQKRTYKSPYTHQEAVQIITVDSETFFDPELIKIFLKFNEKFDEIFNKY